MVARICYEESVSRLFSCLSLDSVWVGVGAIMCDVVGVAVSIFFVFFDCSLGCCYGVLGYFVASCLSCRWAVGLLSG